MSSTGNRQDSGVQPDDQRKTIALALQGGGAHGAFTWGVLHKLLEDNKFKFVAVSGTSAGAMNAVALANGLRKGEHPKAGIESLKAFWHAVSDAGEPFRALQWKNPMTGNWNTDSLPFYEWLHMMGSLYSPYSDPSAESNPLVELLNKHIHFHDLNKNKDEMLPFYICATNVKSMQRKIFSSRAGEISAASVAASAALPSMFRAVEVNGEFYWDGGFMGNPVIAPLLNHQDHNGGLDVLIVEVNPIERDKLPTSPWDIEDRMNEITFNSSLMLELNAIETVNKALEAGAKFKNPKQKVRFHHIPSRLSGYDLGSKSNTNLAFLEELFHLGVAAATDWTRGHWDQVNRESSYPLERLDSLFKN